MDRIARCILIVVLLVAPPAAMLLVFSAPERHDAPAGRAGWDSGPMLEAMAWENCQEAQRRVLACGERFIGDRRRGSEAAADIICQAFLEAGLEVSELGDRTVRLLVVVVLDA